MNGVADPARAGVAEKPAPAFSGRSLLVLLLSLAICGAVAVSASLVTIPQIPGWYATLRKPFFQPPNWLFGPAWTVLYVMMAVAVWQVWRRRSPLTGKAIGLYALQLAFNMGWSFVFFGAHLLPASFAVIVVLEALILWTISLFGRIDRAAMLLLIPYAVWVAYATMLDLSIVVLNGTP
ncbi:TspO and MBR related proteins [Faunimonas pinastri]|uniref:TspO and MBR related proteins n=1 Tax=Faunimonas pinastri TaxID=1855383 RepID=A0A1H9P2M8_9HYPH|nr:TspO/MBR family protein [Faunimonas pinastri]SER42371.1 TspO and MBR related proteins [Faunimonas pinastri]